MQVFSVWVGVISDVVSLLVAVVAIVAIRIGQHNFRAQQKASIRPLLCPQSPPERSDAPAQRTSIDRLYAQERYVCSIANMGLGPAFNVSATLFPPAPGNGAQPDPRRNAVMRLPAIDTRESERVILQNGMTELPGDTTLKEKARPVRISAMRSNTVRRSYTLFSPADRAPATAPMLQITVPVLARMVITYQDIENTKHAAIFDYSLVGGWQLVDYLSDIEKTLDELSEEYSLAAYRMRESAAVHALPRE